MDFGGNGTLSLQNFLIHRHKVIDHVKLKSHIGFSIFPFFKIKC